MKKSLYSKNQRVLLDLLRRTREDAGLRQQDVADAIDEPQSFVSKFESGERRLDVVELREVCNAFGISLTQFCKRLESAIDQA